MGLVCLPLVVVGLPATAVASGLTHVSAGTRMADRMRRLDADPDRGAAVARARQRVGRVLAQTGEARMGLAALRLQAGLSQHQLAERIGTQQANISRWETSDVDLQVSSIHKLARVFGVSAAVVLDAIQVPATGEGDA